MFWRQAEVAGKGGRRMQQLTVGVQRDSSGEHNTAA
jgi:hypothetical protein